MNVWDKREALFEYAFSALLETWKQVSYIILLYCCDKDCTNLVSPQFCREHLQLLDSSDHKVYLLLYIILYVHQDKHYTKVGNF